MWRNYKLGGNPSANEGAVVQGSGYRFTVLTDRMVRMEFNEDGVFEDRATKTVINRELPVPSFRVIEKQDRLLIITDSLRLSYDLKPLAPGGMGIEVGGNVSSYRSKWIYGQAFETLKGTARTLDEADGAIPLEEGLLSANGFSLIDDSKSMLIEADGWVSPRRPGVIDLYFLGYGRDYLGCLKDFFKLAGPAPLIPRFALGNWWSRYYKYTDKEYIALMERFKAEGIPFSVGVIDIDWHHTSIDPKYGSGWTGYTWNQEFFPDYKAFLAKLREMGLKITLNLHPADGIRGHEAMYLEMAKDLGVDYANEDKIPFDAADKAFWEACFKHVFHPYEEDGVDFWWIDWQQEGGTSVAGIDPLWMLNHIHYLDNCRDGRRGLTFSRYAGLGSHRYPVGFSGDTYATWESLDFQPYFTATASNAGYGWWSHDIGGHMHGYKDDEMALRWVQLGVFSPIMRLHSTSSPFNQKEPWMFGPLAERGMKAFLRLRHRLAPYLYTMNHRFNAQGEPLIQPMYYSHPYTWEAYEVKNQYWFGSELIACPITAPADTVTAMGKFTAWLPEGRYTDIFNGRVYQGGRKLALYRDLEHMPVLAKAGAIVPLAYGSSENAVSENPVWLEVLFFPGSGHFELYEDNGMTGENLRYAITEFTMSEKDERLLITINKPVNNSGVVPENRRYKITVYGVTNEAEGDNSNVNYDKSKKTLSFEFPDENGAHSLLVKIGPPAENNIAAEVFDMLHKAQYDYDLKADIYELVKRGADKTRLIGELASLNLDKEIFGALTEIITA
ncbi:MAG: glycoside hydrolase family 31 protein [Clostridiales bacterium]|nr:glycoside hydrolase family 31 protein [Clostridiales bacterium]